MASREREAEILRGNARLPTDAATKGTLQRLFTERMDRDIAEQRRP